MLATVDSNHAWANGLFATLAGGGDSEHDYSVRENTLLNARADSEHAWNVIEHAGIDARLDSNDTNFTARARGTISLTDAGGDGSASYNAATGVITYTGPSPAEVRAHISLTDLGGDGSASYNATTGVITYTGPSAAEVRAHLSGGNGITYTAGTGVIDQTARTINTISYNGTANIVVEPFVERDDASNATRRLTFVDDATAGHKRLNMDTALTFNPATGTLTSTNYEGTVNGGTFP
jgi:hypothetical protein